MREEIRRQLEAKRLEQEKQTMAEKTEAPAVFTQEQFMQMMSLMMKENREATLAAIAEFKKPDAFTLEEQEKKRKLELQNRIDRMNSAIAEEKSKRDLHFRCSHIKLAEGVMKQSHAFVGQVNSDGYFRPVCCRCTRVFPRVKASDEHIRNGVGLRNIPGVTAEIILGWHLKTDPNCKECAKGLCAVQQLREIRQGHLDPLPEVTPEGKIRAEQAVAAMV